MRDGWRVALKPGSLRFVRERSTHDDEPARREYQPVRVFRQGE
jgi:hypothetical protein